jgi:hypothetical protein
MVSADRNKNPAIVESGTPIDMVREQTDHVPKQKVNKDEE